MNRYLLAGPSGVGKASFVNNLIGREVFRVDHYISVPRHDVEVAELPQGNVQLSILRGWMRNLILNFWLRICIQEVLQDGLDAILYFIPINIARIDLRPGGGAGPTCYRRILHCLRESFAGQSTPPVWIVFTMCNSVDNGHRNVATRVFIYYVAFWLSRKSNGIELH